jgi:hypothetical protein
MHFLLFACALVPALVVNDYMLTKHLMCVASPFRLFGSDAQAGVCSILSLEHSIDVDVLLVRSAKQARFFTRVSRIFARVREKRTCCAGVSCDIECHVHGMTLAGAMTRCIRSP